MITTLFSPVYTGTFTPAGYLICTAASLVIGLICAAVSIYKNHYSKSFTITLLLLPSIVQTIIMLVNGSIGTGLAVAGAFSLIRFRSAPGSAKEIISVFMAMAAGLATGIGYVGIAIIFVLLLSAVMIIASSLHIAERPDPEKDLRITVPEALSYAHAFDDIFEKYTASARLRQVKTTNMGSLYKLLYRVEINNEDNVQALIDELRCRNGNLEISVSPAEHLQEAL